MLDENCFFPENFMLNFFEQTSKYFVSCVITIFFSLTQSFTLLHTKSVQEKLGDVLEKKELDGTILTPIMPDFFLSKEKY